MLERRFRRRGLIALALIAERLGLLQVLMLRLGVLFGPLQPFGLERDVADPSVCYGHGE